MHVPSREYLEKSRLAQRTFGHVRHDPSSIDAPLATHSEWPAFGDAADRFDRDIARQVRREHDAAVARRHVLPERRRQLDDELAGRLAAERAAEAAREEARWHHQPGPSHSDVSPYPAAARRPADGAAGGHNVISWTFADSLDGLQAQARDAEQQHRRRERATRLDAFRNGHVNPITGDSRPTAGPPVLSRQCTAALRVGISRMGSRPSAMPWLAPPPPVSHEPVAVVGPRFNPITGQWSQPAAYYAHP